MHETDATAGEGQFTTGVGRPGGTGRDDAGTAGAAVPGGPTAGGSARGYRPGHGYRRSGFRGVHPRGERNGGSDVGRPDVGSGIDRSDCGSDLRPKGFVDTLPAAVRTTVAACDPAGMALGAPLVEADR